MIEHVAEDLDLDLDLSKGFFGELVVQVWRFWAFGILVDGRIDLHAVVPFF